MRRSSSLMELAFVVVVLFVFTFLTGGCGGGHSSYIDENPETNIGEPPIAPEEPAPEAPKGTDISDVRTVGSVVEIDIIWDGQGYTYTFENNGEKVFDILSITESTETEEASLANAEAKEVSPENLDAIMVLQDDGMLNVSFSDSNYGDLYMSAHFNCVSNTYNFEYSGLIQNFTYRLFGFGALRVNGASTDATYSMDYEYVEREYDEYTLADADVMNSTIAVNATINNELYHVVFRNVNGTFELIDGREEEYSMITMSHLENEWLNVLFETKDGIWLSARFYYADNTYEVSVADGYSGKIDEIYVNGFEVIESLTWTYDWWKPNGRPARIEDIEAKNTQVEIGIMWKGMFEYFKFLNLDGENNFSCEGVEDDANEFSNVKLSAGEGEAVFTFTGQNETESMTITVTYVDGTYKIDLSSSIPETEKGDFDLAYLSVNSTIMELTSAK